MTAGIISSTPLWVPVAVGVAAIGGAGGLGYGGYKLYKLRLKINSTAEGEEAQFTESEARIVEKLIKRLSRKQSGNDTAE
jgi:hypothetical protein